MGVCSWNSEIRIIGNLTNDKKSETEKSKGNSKKGGSWTKEKSMGTYRKRSKESEREETSEREMKRKRADEKKHKEINIGSRGKEKTWGERKSEREK